MHSALKYSRTVPNSKARLQYLDITGIYDDLSTKPKQFNYHIYGVQKNIWM